MIDHRGNLDQLTGMDPLQRARYDSAVQRYHDAVAAHRATFESELRKAKDTVDQLHRQHTPKRAGETTDMDGDTQATKPRTRRRPSTVTGPVQSILNKGG